MSKFEITSIKVHKLQKTENSNIVGVASIVIDKSFLVTDIRIIQTKDKLFCGMPSKRLSDNSFVDICNPLNKEVRNYLENAIIAEYMNSDDRKDKKDE